MQTNYSSKQLVLHLNYEGYITEVLINTYPYLNVEIGEMAIHLFADASKKDYLSQFQQVLSNDLSFGLRVELTNYQEAIGFFIKNETNIILVLLTMQEEIISLFDEMVKINNDQVRVIRDLYKKIGESNDAIEAFNEIMQLNNSLVNVRRELFLRNKELQVLNDELDRLNQIDYLTQLPNRRKFFVDAYNFNGVEDYKLLMMDFNNFKVVNDELGHNAGDDLLRFFAINMTDFCKAHKATLYRLGGDEFAILMPNSIEVDIEQMINSIDEKIQTIHPLISMAHGSVVIYQDVLSEEHKIEIYMHIADQQMYLVKQKFHLENKINKPL